jgi:DNA-binding LacI/PurR family transcriptional regulator
VFLTQSRHDDAREEQMLATLPARRPEALIMIGSPRQNAHRARIQ